MGTADVGEQDVDEVNGKAATDGVRYRVDGVRAHITLDRPATRNALAADNLLALDRAIEAAVADPRVRLVVLDHTGSVFCSGIDLRGAAGARQEEQPVHALPRLLQRLWACNKPIVAVADGRTRAGGIGLYAVCDLTIASPTSDFATNEVRLGVAPAVISVPFLARVPAAAARQWFLTGEVFDADRARRDGLVDVVTVDLQAALEHYSGAVARGGPLAIAAVKQLLRGAETPESLATRYARLVTTSAALFSSPEGQEGVAAGRGKRPASWTIPPDSGEST